MKTDIVKKLVKRLNQLHLVFTEDKNSKQAQLSV